MRDWINSVSGDDCHRNGGANLRGRVSDPF